jgi:hypothetical protein
MLALLVSGHIMRAMLVYESTRTVLGIHRLYPYTLWQKREQSGYDCKRKGVRPAPASSLSSSEEEEEESSSSEGAELSTRV